MNPAFLFLSKFDLHGFLRRFLFFFFWMATASVLLAQNPWPDAGSVAEAMTRANNYWIANNSPSNSDWARAAYYTGNQRTARVLVNRTYVNWALLWASTNNWLIGPSGPSNPNSYCCGQTYIDLYRMNPQPVDITDISNRVTVLVNSSASNQWTWIDTFYMAGPTVAGMGRLSGNTNYYNKLWIMYSYLKDHLGLYDPTTSLWYRDTSYIYPAKTAANGGKVFWSRGNGWVFAGLARVLQQMSTNSPHYSDFITMFTNMAPAIKAVQGADGMWRSSLFDYAQYPNPETSGTGFFTYGFAWGIRSGLLPAADYTNSVILAWHGMTNLALNANGLVGYVQGSAAAPGTDSATGTFDYGVGAFLLACSEIELLATNGPAIAPWAGPDQMLFNTNASPAMPMSVSLDASATEIYRGPAGNFTWWEGANQLASGTNAQIALPSGQHVITLKIPGVDGITYTDSLTVTVVATVLGMQFDSSGSNLVFTVNTHSNALYILQSTPTLSPPDWTPLVTNTGSGNVITNSRPFNSGAPQQFFRYLVQ